MFNHVFNHHVFTGELCYKRLSHFYYTKLNIINYIFVDNPFISSPRTVKSVFKQNNNLMFISYTVFILFQCCVDSPVIRVMCKLCDIIANVIDFKSNHWFVPVFNYLLGEIFLWTPPFSTLPFYFTCIPIDSKKYRHCTRKRKMTWLR